MIGLSQWRQWLGLTVACAASGLAHAQQAETVSEKDYLDDMPIVLSVSRLPQRLDETPGAVTILDRAMIRATGARHVADLFRFVPGFQVSDSFQQTAPQVSYHANMADLANYGQVLIDGRAVYSPYSLGSIGTGLQSVAIDDIERIEIMRGSNSATYGGRAFLGTINIVTRDALDSLGTSAELVAGEYGLRDATARVVWGNNQAATRITVNQRREDGLKGAAGATRVRNVQLQTNLHPDNLNELTFRAGQSEISSVVKDETNQHDQQVVTSFLQFDAKHTLDANQDLAFQASVTTESIQSLWYFYLGGQPIVIDYSGRTTMAQLSLQHNVRLGDNFRMAWGGELRQERVNSAPIYATPDDLRNNFVRVFGNAEWRMSPTLLLNLGGLAEQSDYGGSSLSPRMMFNWHSGEGHALRAGVSRAFRPPSAFEKFAYTRYYLPDGTLADILYMARGAAESGTILAREIGYLGSFPERGLEVDVRLFNERLSNLNNRHTISVAGDPNSIAYDYFAKSADDYSIRGLEYQLKYQLWEGGPST